MENNNTQAYLKNTNWKHNGELLNYACKIIDNEIKLGYLSEDTKIKNLINDRLYSFAEKLAKKFNVSVNEAIGELKNAYVLHSVNYHINKSEKNESKNSRNMKKNLIKEAQNAPFYLEDGEDMSVTRVVVRETPDSYYDFEAILGNGWYSLNGSYNGEVIYDNFIMGNGGHGQQISLKPEVLNWLDINVTPQLEQKINSKINSGSVERLEADNVYESKIKNNVVKLNESELKKIVAESVKIILKESFIGGDNQFDDNIAQKAQSPSDVFKMNYWTGRTESKGNGELILRCYTDNNSMATRNYPDFEKVVNDLNQYYKLHGSKSIAQALPDDGVSRGRLLKITKRA